MFTNATKRRGAVMGYILLALVVAAATALITALLVNIFQRKQEAKDPYLILNKVTEDTVDAKVWGTNWPREYDGYAKTSVATRTKFGGGSLSEGTMPAQKAERDPWLTRMFAGYAFALDYRDRRGHAYMLQDQEATRRVLERPQPGACLHCHASIMPLYRKAGKEALPNGTLEEQTQAGFVAVCKMKYQDANKMLKDNDWHHPVSCVDCHDSKTMELRVTRPGFINGIKTLKASEGVKDYDPNRDASRQEMRSYVCAQCHVEYYCGPKETLLFPWANGTKVEQIESFYENHKFPDGSAFYDFAHAETGAHVFKAQHPEFEVWSQGIHARSGVACADCHMPYKREGALKVSEHWVRSPLLQVNRSCQPCHPYSDQELIGRVEAIQDRHYALMKRAGSALVDMLDAIKVAKAAGATEPQLDPLLTLQRKAQWRLDFVAAENSMGFHAPQELARVLAESIDYSRQAQAKAVQLTVGPAATTRPVVAP